MAVRETWCHARSSWAWDTPHTTQWSLLLLPALLPSGSHHSSNDLIGQPWPWHLRRISSSYIFQLFLVPEVSSELVTEHQFHLAGQSMPASTVATSLDIPALHALVLQEPTEGRESMHQASGWISPEDLWICHKSIHGKAPCTTNAISEEFVSLTFERRLILSSLSSRTRRLGGTYQKQTFVCWGYIEKSKIHTHSAQTGNFENSKDISHLLMLQLLNTIPTFKSVITFEMPDFHNLIQLLLNFLLIYFYCW